MIGKSENSTRRPPNSEKHKAGPVAIICLSYAHKNWAMDGSTEVLQPYC